MGTAMAAVYGKTSTPGPLSLWSSSPGWLHTVQFYEDESFLLETIALSIGAAIAADDLVVVIVTKAHQEQLAALLVGQGIDLPWVVAREQAMFLDADETMAQFMVDGQFDPSRFAAVVHPLLGRLAILASGASRRRIFAYGEMAPMLWASGNRDAALALEHNWDRLVRENNIQLCCAYPMGLFAESEDGAHLLKLCDEHSHLIAAENHLDTAIEDPVRSVLLLQQKVKSLEAELRGQRKSERSLYRFGAIVESCDDAIISKDLDGIIASWNLAAERVFGYKAEEVIGKSIDILIPPELHPDEVVIRSKIRAGERIDHYQTRRVHKNGSLIDISLTISPIIDRYGHVIGCANILRDITRQKRIEQMLHTSERLASVGRLAATIAHEINNPLEAITNFIYLAKQQPELSPDTRNYLITADQELARVAHIVQQTLGFYRQSSGPSSRLVAAVLEDVLTVYDRKIHYKELSVELRIEPDLSVHTMQGELKQILSNLVANAMDASRQGGRILIRARSTRNQRSGEVGVRITVADYGCGISPQCKARLFVPFFTTKKEIGTGLGLWISRDLLQKRGGNIRFRSRDAAPSGTVMSVYLPLTPPATSSPAPSAATAFPGETLPLELSHAVP